MLEDHENDHRYRFRIGRSCRERREIRTKDDGDGDFIGSGRNGPSDY